MADNSNPLTNGGRGPQAIPTTCTRCGIEFESKMKYQEHIASRSCLRYKCEHCTEGSQTKAELEKHYKEAHPEQKGIRQQRLEARREVDALSFQIKRKNCHIRGRIFCATSFVCKTCEETFATIVEARQHLTTHDPPPTTD